MGPATFPLLRLLADGRFHSGEDLAKRLGRSRATVSEALKFADELGVDVFSVPGKGYKLASPVEFLDAARIVQGLGGAASRVRLTLADEADSTSTRLAALAQQGAPSGTCIAAEWQSAGRAAADAPGNRRWAPPSPSRSCGGSSAAPGTPGGPFARRGRRRLARARAVRREGRGRQVSNT